MEPEFREQGTDISQHTCISVVERSYVASQEFIEHKSGNFIKATLRDLSGIHQKDSGYKSSILPPRGACLPPITHVSMKCESCVRP